MKQSPRNQAGQVSFVVGIILLTLVALFMFVINLGVLVHAKINLQNAADLAAYAGASAQARQLNSVGFLNYEMRRQFKKFLFRYYVLGNMAQKSHLYDPVGADKNRTWVPGDPGTPGYGVPAVCVIFNQDNNTCQVITQRPIQVNQPSPLDAIATALNQQLKALERIRVLSCGNMAKTNELILYLWLFNTDPDLKIVAEQLASANSGGDAKTYLTVLSTLRGLGSGLGLIPRETLLLQRIKTLETYLNTPPMRLNLDMINGLQKDPDIGQYERSIQAFLSAYETLGSHVFPANSIEMQEILPSELARFETAKGNFEAWYVAYPNVNLQSTKPQECKGAPERVRITDAPLAVYKDPEIMTYYAVRLKAKVQFLLFSPFREMQLKAYAAARPFGSRIGPPFGELSFPFTNITQRPSAAAVIACGDCVGTPNLPVYEDDSTQGGWNTTLVNRQMFAQFEQPQNQAQQVITTADMERAYQIAMVPNPWEKGRFIIPYAEDVSPDDPLRERQGDPFQIYFDASGRMPLWAPLIAEKKSTNPEEAILNELKDSIPSALRNALSAALSSYVSQMSRGLGEDGEGTQTVKIRNPFRVLPGFSNSGPIELSPAVMMKDPKDIKSSWNTERNGPSNEDIAGRGRIGYSVKLVSFESLLKPDQIRTDGGQTIMKNTPNLDPESELDLSSLLH